MNLIFEEVYQNIIWQQKNQKAINASAEKIDELIKNLKTKQDLKELKKFLQTDPVMKKIIDQLDIDKDVQAIVKDVTGSVQTQQKDEKEDQKDQDKQKDKEPKKSKEDQEDINEIKKRLDQLEKKYKKAIRKKSILPKAVTNKLITGAVIGLGLISFVALYPKIFPETVKAAKENYKEKQVSQIQNDNNADIERYNKETKSVRQAIDNTQATVVKTVKTSADAASRPVTTTVSNTVRAAQKLSGNEKSKEEQAEQDKKIEKAVDDTKEAASQGFKHPIKTTTKNIKAAGNKIKNIFK